MQRTLLVALGALFFVFAQNFSASAQAPIIVDLAGSLLRGIATGAGEEAGKEIYDRIRNPAPTSSPSSEAPQNGASISPSYQLPNENPPRTVPIEPPTPPDGLRWRMNNLHGDNITMQFYSATRNHFHWPGGNRAYLLMNDQPVTIALRCVPGEKICYGGAAPGRYWGTGLGFRHQCANCCRICGSEERGTTLR